MSKMSERNALEYYIEPRVKLYKKRVSDLVYSYGLNTENPFYYLIITSITRCILHKDRIHLLANTIAFLIVFYICTDRNWRNIFYFIFIHCYINSICIYLYRKYRKLEPKILAGISDVICSLYTFYVLKTITIDTTGHLFLKIVIDEYIICYTLNKKYNLHISISSHMMGYMTGFVSRIILDNIYFISYNILKNE